MEAGEGFVPVCSGLSREAASATLDILRQAAFDARLIEGDEPDGSGVAVPADQMEDALAILNPLADTPQPEYRPDPLTAAMPLIVAGVLLLVIVAATLAWRLVLNSEAVPIPGALWGILFAITLVGIMLLFGPLLSSPVRERAAAIQARKSKIVS